MKGSPCKGCADRYPACHDHCERYLAIKAENDVIRHKMQNDIGRVFNNMSAEKKMKRQKKFKGDVW